MLSTKLKEAAGNSADATLYVDDVFSTYLYTGNGSTQTITNGIDLAGKGGMVWTKSRSAATDHKLTDTTRGATKALISNTYAPQTTDTTGLTAFSSTGFSLGANSVYNTNAATYASWTFRKAAKFFDVVTATSVGSTVTFNHNLGASPGMVIIKATTFTEDWYVYHRSMGSGYYGVLNTTGVFNLLANSWTVSSTSVSYNFAGAPSGSTYVAYLFAHDTSSTGIIQCGSYTGNGTTNNISLGWEAQYVLIKSASSARPWVVFDTMRGFCNSSSPSSNALFPNASTVETSYYGPTPTATGFGMLAGDGDFDYNASGQTYIYMAIRMPNKPPTTGTQVFGLNARTGTGANATVTGGQTDDAVLIKNRGSAVGDLFASRLTGTGYLETSSTAAEVAAGTTILQANPWDVMDGVKVGTTSTITNASANTFINYLFKRAPGFFDEVCYTGTGSSPLNITHNLTVVPELMIIKSRSNVVSWPVYVAPLGNTKSLLLDDAGGQLGSFWNNTTPTTTQFTVGTGTGVNGSSYTYVAYLFATLAGISKVGSYTGNGSSQNIDCGFAAGARFFLVKATSTTGSWWVWDSARGITAGNDPALQLNSTAAEITTADAVDPYSPGITVNQEATCSINANGVSYIFLAVA